MNTFGKIWTFSFDFWVFPVKDLQKQKKVLFFLLKFLSVQEERYLKNFSSGGLKFSEGGQMVGRKKGCRMEVGFSDFMLKEGRGEGGRIHQGYVGVELGWEGTGSMGMYVRLN